MPRKNVLVQEQEQGYSTAFSRRIPINYDKNKAFDELRTSMEEARKDWKVAKVSDVRFINDGTGLEVNGEELSLAAKGSSSLLKEFKLDGMTQALSQLSDKVRARAIAKEVVEEVMKERKNSFLRFHTANVGGSQQIVHVANTKHNAVSELDLFDQIREASQAFNFVPVRVDGDLEKVKMQLLQVDDGFNLEPHGLGAYEFNGNAMDKYLGMLTVTVSETTAANEVLAGIYREICSNGAILGAEDELQMRAIRGAKESFAKFLKVVFETIAGRSGKIRGKIENLRDQQFGQGSFTVLETLMSDNNVIRPWNQFIKDDMAVMVETSSKLDAYHLLTLRAHDERITPENQLRLERVAGKYLAAVN